MFFARIFLLINGATSWYTKCYLLVLAVCGIAFFIDPWFNTKLENTGGINEKNAKSVSRWIY